MPQGPLASGIVWILKEMQLGYISNNALKDYSGIVLIDTTHNTNTFS